MSSEMRSEEALVRSKRIAALARSFPSLRYAPGLEPFKPAKLDAWAASDERENEAKHAAQFVLAIAKPRGWKVGRFNVLLAMRRWDDAHRAAFIAWAKNPFFC